MSQASEFNAAWVQGTSRKLGRRAASTRVTAVCDDSRSAQLGGCGSCHNLEVAQICKNTTCAVQLVWM